jgi:hypothetical protein
MWRIYLVLFSVIAVMVLVLSYLYNPISIFFPINIAKHIIFLCLSIYRADLVCYYSALSDVAEKRLQRAEWRIKRMKLQEKRLELKSDDTEPITTIRSPNNNEDLEDINSNLSILNSMHLEETNGCVDIQNNTEAMNTAIENYNIQNNIEASNRQLNINNSKLYTKSSGMCVTQGCDSKVDESLVSEKSLSSVSDDRQIVEHITDNKSSKVETNSEWNKGGMNMESVEVVSVISLEVNFANLPVVVY